LSWEKFDEETANKIKRQQEFEEKTAKKLAALSETAQNPLIKALLHSIVLDTTKHAETYKMLLDLNTNAIMGKESKGLGKAEIASHLREETLMLKQAKEISKAFASARVRVRRLPEALWSFRSPAEFNDICLTEGVCTRLSAPVGSSTGWRRAM